MAVRAKAILGTRSVLAPPPDLSLSQWAEEHFRLSAENSSQPGRWRCYPFQRGIMDAVSDVRNRKITVMKSARVGYTKTIVAAIGYHVHQDPCGMLVVQPTVEDAQGFSKDEIAPMLRDCSRIGQLVQDESPSEETILHKGFPGGQLTLVGANSARGFRRITVRKVLFDEIDGYPPSAGEEGDQLLLGARRADTAWNSQIIYGSTPTIKGLSRIASLYEESDKRRYNVHCPFCGHMHPLEWSRFTWKEPYTTDNPCFVCPSCQKGFGYEYHHQIIERGQWIAEAPFTGHAGFFVWAAYSYSPACVWKKLVEEWHRVVASKNPTEIRTFINTQRGEVYELDAVKVDQLPLMQRAEEYTPDNLPAGVWLLTAGVDVQQDRLAVEVVGWSKLESWSVLWEEWYGNPLGSELWDRLDQLLDREFTRADGRKMKLAAMGVDCGYEAPSVYKFTQSRIMRRVFAVKGKDGESTRIVAPLRKGGDLNAKFAWVYTFAAKDALYGRLKNETPGTSGYCHFPKSHGPEYYAQLTSERWRVQYTAGKAKRIWEPISVGRRNEALDCRCYSMAALDLIKPDWVLLEKNLAARSEAAAQTPAQVEKTDGQTVPQNLPVSASPCDTEQEPVAEPVTQQEHKPEPVSAQALRNQIRNHRMPRRGGSFVKGW